MGPVVFNMIFCHDPLKRLLSLNKLKLAYVLLITFQMIIFMNEKYGNIIGISLQFLLDRPIVIKSSLVRVMAWQWTY